MLKRVAGVRQLNKFRASRSAAVEELNEQLEVTATHNPVEFAVQREHWDADRAPSGHEIEVLQLLVVGSGAVVLLIIASVPEGS